MDQTVNLTSPTSVVRIYLFPPKKRQKHVENTVFAVFSLFFALFPPIILREPCQKTDPV